METAFQNYENITDLLQIYYDHIYNLPELAMRLVDVSTTDQTDAFYSAVITGLQYYEISQGGTESFKTNFDAFELQQHAIQQQMEEHAMQQQYAMQQQHAMQQAEQAPPPEPDSDDTSDDNSDYTDDEERSPSPPNRSPSPVPSPQRRGQRGPSVSPPLRMFNRSPAPSPSSSPRRRGQREPYVPPPFAVFGEGVGNRQPSIFGNSQADSALRRAQGLGAAYGLSLINI